MARRWKKGDRAARRALIREMFQPGAKAKDIALAIEASVSTVHADMRAMGWPIPAPVNPRTRAQSWALRRSVLAAVAADPQTTLQAIGDRFEVTRERVRQIIAEAGIQKPKAPRHHPKWAAYLAHREARKQRKVEIWAAALALRGRGLTYAAIAEEMGVSPTAAHRYVRRGQAAGITVTAAAHIPTTTETSR